METRQGLVALLGCAALVCACSKPENEPVITPSAPPVDEHVVAVEKIRIVAHQPAPKQEASNPDTSASATTSDSSESPLVAPGVATERRRQRLVQTLSSEVKNHWDELRACYEHESDKKPDLAGTVVIRATIAPSGNVVKVGDDGSTIPDDAVVQCVQQVFVHAQFSQFEGAPVTLVYPIEFANEPAQSAPQGPLEYP